MIEMHGPSLTESVPIETLESWLADHPDCIPDRTMLKVDVQGSEREVLNGAGEHLQQFPVLEIEAALSQLYQGEARLPELLGVLSDRGFVAASIMTERFHRDGPAQRMWTSSR